MSKLFNNWQHFATFPCKGNSKVPATHSGFKDAQFGQDVTAMLKAGYNAAMACEKSGVVVIDIDYHDEKSTAMEDLKALEVELGAKLPRTLTQSTASGNGKHLIYSSKGITSPKGKIGKYCDIKHNGYIMIAPSAVNGKQYEIIDGIDENGYFILAELPQAWLDYINKDVPSNNEQSHNPANSDKEHKIYRNLNIGQMFNNCAFLRYCRDNADCLSEPEWHSMITVLAQIEDSDELIHTLSEPYPNYSYDETQKKINYAREFGHPQTCGYLSENYPEICKNCPSSYMATTSNFASDSEDKNPLTFGKQTIADLFNKNQKRINAMSFISSVSISCKSEDYNLPKLNKFLYQAFNKTFLLEKREGGLRIKLLANFIITDVKECTLIYNDKSGKKPHRYYVVSLKNDKGRVENDVEIAYNSKSDVNQFQTTVNNLYTGFAVCMKEPEFKTFVEEYISPKVASTATIYTNAGITPDGNLLYENALVTPNCIYWSDESGYIKTGENTYVRLAEATHYLPKLAKSDKTGKQVANELMTNILECWNDNIILPLLTLGHMVMSLYFNDFIKRYGVPTLILYGETGTGKSTLVTVGLSIFGLSREALTSGGSTAKSNEYFCSRYNCLNVCIDDVKGETLTSSNFTALIKAAYKAVPRTKLLPYGRGVEYIHTCSPLAYSTNESLPDLKEVINRMNVIEIFGKIFKADKFKYHEVDNGNSGKLKELSLILTEFLKYSKEDIIKLYEQVFELLKLNVQDTQNRVISNIAYAYTGAIMLLAISDIELENLQEQLIEFAQKQVEKYENIKTVVEKVLSEIVTLFELRYLEKDTHFKMAKVTIGSREELQIRFKKDVIISAINKYYGSDKRKCIDEHSFLSYAKNHKRYRGNITSRLGGKPGNTMCFDVTNLEEYSDFGSMIEPMSYEDLKKGIEGNNM